ncbi:DUF2127 domain-containing protein [Candidatus Saccharibacteria bacterium]|nr:DUF2127 domain-containing protein [Candidatus Saccharibacteria bacterium]
MHDHPISQTWLDRWFKIVLVFKGIDGALELIGGLALLLVPSASLHAWIITIGQNDLVVDHDWLTHAVTSLGHSFTPGIQMYTAAYLLLHGVIKVGLVIALLSRKYALYPAAIVVLILFMLYQIYRIFTEGHWVFDGLLTVIDGLVVWLTIIEYRRHQAKVELPTS